MIIINQFDQGKKGYFEATENSVEAGKLFYTWAGTDKLIIDHTEVNDAFGGRGVGKKLVLSVVDFAREKRIKIMPLCPFAKSVFDKNADIQDVLF